jgi:phospholipid/cholesterol/gamma-HCH transport system substrate-binding protein
MAKRTNPKLIGSFVVGAIALVILGVFAFGGGQFLKPKLDFVLYFQGSLSGLDVGSPVTFRGVRVGSVKAVTIKYNITKEQLRIPVHIELEADKFQLVSGESNPKRNIPALIERGLRAQLATISLVTGQTAINLDFYPETPVRLIHAEPETMELPTIPSDIDLLKANVSSLLVKINKLPLEKLSDEMAITIESANQALKDADNVIKSTGILVANVNAQVKPLSEAVTGTLTHANGTLNAADSLLREAEARLELRPGEPLQNLNEFLIDGRSLVNNVNRAWPGLVAAAELMLKTVDGTLDKAATLLNIAQVDIAPSSPLYFETLSILREARFAANAIKVLAEYLQRNPSAVLTGNH